MVTNSLDSRQPGNTNVNPLQATNQPSELTDKQYQSLLRPIPRPNLRTLVLVIIALGIVAWGVQGTQASPSDFISGIPGLLKFIGRLFPIQLETDTVTFNIGSYAFTIVNFPLVIQPIVETVQMAIIGTLGALIVSLPFGLLAARNVSPHPIIYQTVRLVLNAGRALPEIIYALIFVSAVGLGPFAGVLSLIFSSIGSMSKLYAEAIEAIDPAQVMAVRATGAGPLQIFMYSVVPQAFPLIVSYSLILFETNIRAATILGIVGAGGVGFTLNRYLALYQFHYLLGTVLLLIVVVTVIDRLSAYVRKRVT